MALSSERRCPRPAPDPTTHLGLEELERLDRERPPSPRDRGRVELLCARREGEERGLPEDVELDGENGFPGDRWGRDRAAGEARHGPELYRQMQLSTMEVAVARLIANGQPLPLFGDNLFLDLDLSRGNLPTGSLVRVGAATLRVTPFPHDGCSQFLERFGGDALRFTAKPDTRDRNRRGIYFQVVEPGRVALGDPVEVLERGAPGAQEA